MNRTIFLLITIGFALFVDSAAYFQNTQVLKITIYPHYFIIPTLMGLIFGVLTSSIIYYYSLARKNEHYENYAKNDYLTNIYNRYGAELLFEQEEKEYSRYRERFSIIMFDIDHFKNVNDLYGHKEGDRILVELVMSAKEELREIDIFSRWGGEEFLVLLPKTDLKNAFEISERLRKKVASTDFKLRKPVTISLGVVCIDADENIRALIKRADDALYQAKQQGRNRTISLSN